ncbi:hypothetical protein BJF78_09245 [Pseudonocardia sp. CNS-139]|nr:hypothetical protein BJF78_09245 [Pseudonocardia sp. CNS-139]
MIFRTLTWVFGAGLALIGVASWVSRAPYGVALTAVDALADLNAVVVGLHLAVGAAVLVFAWCRQHVAGMLVATLAVTGLAAVRIVEMAAGDAATVRQWVLLAPELAGVVVGVLLLLPRLGELRALGTRSA